MSTLKNKKKSEGQNLLQAWMTRQNMTIWRMAKTIGVQHRVVKCWLSGEMRPKLENALKLVNITNNAVPLGSWFEDPSQPRKNVHNASHQSNNNNNKKRRLND